MIFTATSLLMMDFDCPLAFCHKKGEYIEHVEFLSSGGEYFCWLELEEFRLNLGASHCIFIFLSLTIFLLGYSC